MSKFAFVTFLTFVRAPLVVLGTALALVHDEQKILSLEKNIAELALRDAAQTIADEAYKLVR